MTSRSMAIPLVCLCFVDLCLPEDGNSFFDRITNLPAELLDKVNKKAASFESGRDMPEFKLINQKAKPNYFFPTTTDIGLSVGYRLSDKSTIGVGGIYRMI